MDTSSDLNAASSGTGTKTDWKGETKSIFVAELTAPGPVCSVHSKPHRSDQYQSQWSSYRELLASRRVRLTPRNHTPCDVLRPSLFLSRVAWARQRRTCISKSTLRGVGLLSTELSLRHAQCEVRGLGGSASTRANYAYTREESRAVSAVVRSPCGDDRLFGTRHPP